MNKLSVWVSKVTCPRCGELVIIKIMYKGTSIFSIKLFDIDKLLKNEVKNVNTERNN